MKSFEKNSIIIPLITLFVYLLTKNSYTQQVNVSLFVLLIILSVVYYFVLKNKKLIEKKKDVLRLLGIANILFFVGITGWFISPFAFVLYLFAIGFAFLYSKQTSFMFILILILLTIGSFGQVAVTYDFLLFISLLALFPLTNYCLKHFQFKKEAIQ